MSARRNSLRGLSDGGFDFDVLGWKESDRLRSLSVSLAKNNAKFHRLKNGSFGLRSWYDEEFLKRATAKKPSAVDENTEVETAGPEKVKEPKSETLKSVA